MVSAFQALCYLSALCLYNLNAYGATVTLYDMMRYFALTLRPCRLLCQSTSYQNYGISFCVALVVLHNPSLVKAVLSFSDGLYENQYRQTINNVINLNGG